MRVVWLIFGLIVLGLGCLGVVLPLLPTVPFILLAAFCFAKSSNRLHNWLLTHRLFGKMIQDWRQSGAISTSAKKMATLSIALVFAISVITGVKPLILTIQAAVLSCVLLFIWTRPAA
jgi:uncharacterized membrane protein YbaN (DUF454 family)